MKKPTTRRNFISKTALATLALPLLGTSIFSCNSVNKSKLKDVDSTSKKLKILILGGTSYLGPHQVAYAINRGHSVSIFTRGKTKPTLYKEAFNKVEHLIGDRENNLSALKNRKWDVVIDNSGQKVQWAIDSADLLKNNVNLYMYTSSTGVYYPYLKASITEDMPLVLSMPEGLTDDEKYEQDYGIMKANSELEIIKIFGKNKSTIIRPTYMLGPGDKTNRFVHWPTRLSEGGEVLVPGKKEDLVQYIDVRDAAEWFINLAENKISGTYNAVGPKSKQTIYEFIEKASKSFNKNTSITMIYDYSFLEKNDIFFQAPWLIPNKKHFGSARIKNEKAIEKGLTFRSLNDTVIDTFNWWNSDAVSKERKTEYNQNNKTLAAREKELLLKWKNYKKV